MSKTKINTTPLQRPAQSKLLQGMLGAQVAGSAKVDPRLVPVIKRHSNRGGANVQYGLDMSSAPVPQRRYAAELCALSFDGFEAKFVFAQRCLVGDGLDSALVIRMNPVAVAQFSESILEMGSPSLAEIAVLAKLRSEDLSAINSNPNQTASMVANICAVAISGHEVCLDFYHASAFAMSRSIGRSDVELEPVVRVDLRTSMFVSLTNGIAKIHEQIKQENNQGV